MQKRYQRSVLTLLVLGLSAATVGAAQFVPAPAGQSPTSINADVDAARQKRDAAQAAAQAVYYKAMADSEKAYIADLDGALKSAMAKGPDRLDEAVKIQAEKKAAQEELDKDLNFVAQAEPSHRPHSVVYACAGDGSMAGDKGAVLELELKKAVVALDPSQSFNVLVYQEGANNGRGLLELNDRLMPATPHNIAKAMDFVDNKYVFHGTKDPMPAIQEAFREHPDVLYLMSDGTFNKPSDADALVDRIAAYNHDKATHVNTIMLLGTKKEDEMPDTVRGIEIMKKIATDNGGAFMLFHASEF